MSVITRSSPTSCGWSHGCRQRKPGRFLIAMWFSCEPCRALPMGRESSTGSVQSRYCLVAATVAIDTLGGTIAAPALGGGP
jgi:hypothetical protein